MSERPIVWFKSHGSAVSALQAILTANGCYVPAAGYEDAPGVFGKQTDAAVRIFQSREGLIEDGIVDDYLWGLLEPDGGQASTVRTDPAV